jgi:hypothetical protein
VAGMGDQLQMCSFGLLNLLPIQEPRGVKFSNEPTCKSEGEDSGNTQNIFESLITSDILIRRYVISILKAFLSNP